MLNLKTQHIEGQHIQETCYEKLVRVNPPGAAQQ